MVVLVIVFKWYEIHLTIHNSYVEAEQYLDLFKKDEVQNFRIEKLHIEED